MKKKEIFVISGAAIIIFMIIGVVAIYLFRNLEEPVDPVEPIGNQSGEAKIEQFSSEEEFHSFLESSQYREYSYGFEDGFINELSAPTLDSAESDIGSKNSGALPDRYSSTNVQVLAIDEADIVKTDGKDIYYSRESNIWIEPIPLREEEILDTETIISEPRYIPPSYSGLTSIISAFPPTEMEMVGEIEEGGNLYLHEKKLIIETNEGFITYDVSDPSSPEKLWEYNFADDIYLVTSRMYNGELFVVLGKYVYRDIPCITPLMIDGINNNEIASFTCTDLYYPTNNESYDQTFTAMKVNPENGDVTKQISFLGSSYNTVVYMSENYIYFTYPNSTDEFTVIYGFINENKDLFNQNYLQRIEKLDGYDISNSSKLEELRILTDQFFSSLSEDERMRVETEIVNRMNEYSDKHIRDFNGTGIIKIGNSSLKIVANGSVPGTPLDQFSLDEYNGYLRIATNVDPYNSGFYYFSRSGGAGGSMEEENDVMVLDDSLNVVGEVRGLGLDEDIYSTRFIGDVAYVVTFKQIDPFYVIDLSVPTDPLVQGELKIPGYSSYLHPLSNDLILGVGQENFRVKLSLFDVSDPTNPVELSKYSLGENWTEVESNHHAFLHDPEHKVFFIPTYQGGYVISYEGNDFEIAKTVSGYNINRAIYINDFMYIIGDEKVVVLNENTWETVKEFQF